MEKLTNEEIDLLLQLITLLKADKVMMKANNITNLEIAEFRVKLESMKEAQNEEENE